MRLPAKPRSADSSKRPSRAYAPILDRLGCFVANVAAERGALHEETRAFLNENERETIGHLRAALDRAAAEGDLDGGRDREALAQTLFALHNGINVLGRYHEGAERLEGVVGEAMRLVG